MNAIRVSAPFLYLAVASIVLSSCAPEPVGPWAGWRGPTGMGLSQDQGLPTLWSEGSENIRWEAVLDGDGNSSPIVVDGMVFVTSADPDTHNQEERDVRRLVTAIDLETGETVWSRDLSVRPIEKRHHLNSYSAPTPASDGETLFVYLGSELAALDLEGNVRWMVTVEPEYVRYSRYGAASSPVLTRDSVILFQDREWGDTEDSGWLAAFAKEDGRELWRVEWMDTCCAYSTPIFRPESGELIVAHSGTVRGYDPATGEILWIQDHEMGQTVPSPVLEGNVLAMSGGGNQRRATLAVRLNGEWDRTEPELLWQIELKLASKTASPVLVDGLFYVVTETGVLVCYEAETGKVLYTERLMPGNYRSSIVSGEGKLYITNQEGVTSVVRVSREFELLAENDLTTGSNASPAFADGCLLLRSPSRVFCIEKETEAMVAAAAAG